MLSKLLDTPRCTVKSSLGDITSVKKNKKKKKTENIKTRLQLRERIVVRKFLFCMEGKAGVAVNELRKPFLPVENGEQPLEAPGIDKSLPWWLRW